MGSEDNYSPWAVLIFMAGPLRCRAQNYSRLLAHTLSEHAQCKRILSTVYKNWLTFHNYLVFY